MKFLFLYFWLAVTGLAHVVFIADRQDGVPGDGTTLNPYDCSTPEKFDGIFRPLYLANKPDVTVFIHPGTYDTWGIGDTTSYGLQGTHGFQCLGGWSFNSLGVRAAKFYLKKKDGMTPNDQRLAVFSTQDGVNNIKFSGLFIDANGAELNATMPEATLLSINGIVGRGSSNITVEDCEFTDIWCDFADAGSAVWIVAITRHCKEIRFLRNYVHDVNAHSHGLLCHANNEHTWETSVRCVIRDNVFIGPGAIPVGGQYEDSYIENNYIDGWEYGLFQDTGYTTNVTYRGNIIKNTHYAVYFSGGYYSASPDRSLLSRCRIMDNIIYVTNSGVGIYLGENCMHNMVNGNRLIYTPPNGHVPLSGIFFSGGGMSTGNYVGPDNILEGPLVVTE